MPAYVVIETDVTDPERYEQYKAAGLVVGRSGWWPLPRPRRRAGRVRGRLAAIPPGGAGSLRTWPPLGAGMESEAYQEARELREGAAHLRVVAVQGID